MKAEPPHNIEAEKAVLGGLMIDGRAWDTVADQVESGDFFRYDHQQIFKAIGTALERQKEADLVLVDAILQERGQSEEIGGMGYLASLANDTPTAANVGHYASVVREASRQREAAKLGMDLTQEATQPGEKGLDAVLDRAGQQIFQLTQSGDEAKDRGLTHLNDVMRRAYEDLREKHEIREQGGTVGMPTGIGRFDNRFGGFMHGDYIIVAGRPSMGKTGYALTVQRNLAEAGYKTAMFSLEMPDVQLNYRLWAQKAKVPVEKFRSGDLSEDEWPRVAQAVSRLKDAPIHIDDASDLTPSQIYRRARQLKQEQGLDMVLVDYIQLLEPEGGENRQQEVSELSRGLKRIAKELNVGVMVMAQLSRELEKRQDKRPQMADLRESGALEQDADIILFPWRPGVYFDTDPDTGAPLQGGEARLLVEKMRQGPTGQIHCAYVENQTMFADLDPHEVPD
ncbi:replicative DNA helicase [Thiohalorhabdus sp.]|uniref:replicative DNA helicase n=1 Tax=Thiohalorhabdus sp. TaxID=3094134 RepID=UPI002FC3D3F9